MKIKVGDNVRVISGSNKGKEGKIISVLRKEDKVVIEGVNIIKKTVKPTRVNETGGIIEVEAPIHVSNVKKIEKTAEKKNSANKNTKATKETKTTKETKEKTVKTSKSTKSKESKQSK